MVIEGRVREDVELKAEVTAQIEERLGGTPPSVGANASTLPGHQGLAKASERPANFIGIHFFFAG